MENGVLELLKLLKKFQLSRSSCKKPVSKEHLETISRSGCKEWKSLPAHLELEDIVAEDIDKSKTTEREKRHEFLLKWKDMKGSDATYEQLVKALLKIECVQDAETVCQMLKESIDKEQLASNTPATLPHSNTAGTSGQVNLNSVNSLVTISWATVIS